jgi:hypothetical protein
MAHRQRREVLTSNLQSLLQKLCHGDWLQNTADLPHNFLDQMLLYWIHEPSGACKGTVDPKSVTGTGSPEGLIGETGASAAATCGRTTALEILQLCRGPMAEYVTALRLIHNVTCMLEMPHAFSWEGAVSVLRPHIFVLAHRVKSVDAQPPRHPRFNSGKSINLVYTQPLPAYKLLLCNGFSCGTESFSPLMLKDSTVVACSRDMFYFCAGLELMLANVLEHFINSSGAALGLERAIDVTNSIKIALFALIYDLTLSAIMRSSSLSAFVKDTLQVR